MCGAGILWGEQPLMVPAGAGEGAAVLCLPCAASAPFPTCFSLSSASPGLVCSSVQTGEPAAALVGVA